MAGEAGGEAGAPAAPEKVVASRLYWIPKSPATVIKYAPVSIELIQMHLSRWY